MAAISMHLGLLLSIIRDLNDKDRKITRGLVLVVTFMSSTWPLWVFVFCIAVIVDKIRD
jgi:hypothetical protein